MIISKLRAPKFCPISKIISRRWISSQGNWGTKNQCVRKTDVIVTMCEKSHFFWERMRIKRHYKCFLYTQVCVTHTCVSVFPLSYNNIRCEPVSWIHTLLYIYIIWIILLSSCRCTGDRRSSSRTPCRSWCLCVPFFLSWVCRTADIVGRHLVCSCLHDRPDAPASVPRWSLLPRGMLRADALSVCWA